MDDSHKLQETVTIDAGCQNGCSDPITLGPGDLITLGPGDDLVFGSMQGAMVETA